MGCRTDPLGLHSFSAVETQSRARSKNESGCLFTHTFTPKLLQFSFSAFGEVPDLRNSYQRFLGADQTPLPPSGVGPD
jgi:hypothetical protein